MARAESVKKMRRAVDPTLVLFIADVAVAWSVFLLAVLLRFRFDSAAALDSLGALWPRALVFSFWIIVGMLSVGMYRQRQRPRLWELVAGCWWPSCWLPWQTSSFST